MLLEVELQRSLHDARRRCADSIAKGRAADFAINRAGADELGVVEDVEGLDAEEQRLRLRERQILGDRHIVVVRAWAQKEPPLCVARCSQHIHAEGCGVEVVVPVGTGIAVEMERTADVLAVSTVGGTRSTEDDSMMSRFKLRPPVHLAPATHLAGVITILRKET